MQKQIKKYFSFLFLFLFLFPIVEKQIHAFEHNNDLHCAATDKHFHSSEHTCSICDFTSTDSNSSAENNFSFIVSAISCTYDPFIVSVNSPTAFQDLPSRAPPFI